MAFWKLKRKCLHYFPHKLVENERWNVWERKFVFAIAIAENRLNVKREKQVQIAFAVRNMYLYECNIVTHSLSTADRMNRCILVFVRGASVVCATWIRWIVTDTPDRQQLTAAIVFDCTLYFDILCEPQRTNQSLNSSRCTNTNSLFNREWRENVVTLCSIILYYVYTSQLRINENV